MRLFYKNEAPQNHGLQQKQKQKTNNIHLVNKFWINKTIV